MTYQKDQLLYQVELRTPRAESVFLYSVLEAWDHLCCYCSLGFSEGQRYRDVRVHCSIEMKPTLQAILDHLAQQMVVEQISEKIYVDCS